MVLPFVLVVSGGAAHFTLHHHDNLLANPQLFGVLHEMVNAGQKLRKEFELIAIIVGMAVETRKIEIRGNRHSCFEGGKGDLGLLEKRFLGHLIGEVRGDPPESF